LKYLLIAVCLTSQVATANTVGIIGDSISTGGAVHPELYYSPVALWRVFQGQQKVPADTVLIPSREKYNLGNETVATTPQVLWPSIREKVDGGSWLFAHIGIAIARDFFNTEEFSFGYLVGRALGVEGSRISVAAENGARAEKGYIQADRLLRASGGELPEHVIISFTGNDLCARSFDEMTDAKIFEDDYFRALVYLAVNGKSSQSKIYVPAFLNAASLVYEESILNKKIKFYDEEVTCQEARKQMFTAKSYKTPDDVANNPLFAAFAKFLPPNPVLLCPTLFQPYAKEEQRTSTIANRIRSFREAQEKAVERAAAWLQKNQPDRNLKFLFLPKAGQIAFTGDDVAGDCFHLSVNGQAKIADAILDDIKSSK
jgi:lysophospholipase L1-like esterase